MKKRIDQSHAVLDRLRLENGMYLAAGNSEYSYVWLRDSFYEVRPYLHTEPEKYIQTYHTILDMLKKFEDKITYHGRRRAVKPWQYIHSRFDAQTLDELPMEWGHAQHDAVGAILFGIGEGLEAGLPIFRDEHDQRIVEKVIHYLGTCRFWEDKDNGMWEENREVHASSIGAVLAGMKKLRDLHRGIFINSYFIEQAEQALNRLLPWESPTKPVDLAQLSLIYPYNVVSKEMAHKIVKRVEAMLLRRRGVLRYETDSYFSTHPTQDRNLSKEVYIGTEAEWTFGLPWLALAHLHLGNQEEAARYLLWTESVMLEDGSLPELYYADSPQWGPNTPLGWSSAMFLMAHDELEKALQPEQIALF